MSGRSVAGWAAVSMQFVALIGIIRTTNPGTVPGWLTAIGWALMVVGSAILLVAFAGLGRALTPTPVPNESGLQTGGLYRWVRHPIYTGLLLLAVGLVLRGPSTPAVLWLGVLFGVLLAKALWEERMLAEVYPEYAAYAVRTGRFLPRLH